MSSQVIYEKSINNIKALLLLTSNKEVIVEYDGKQIKRFRNNTWNNIKNEIWAQESLIDFTITDYINRNRTNKEFEDAVRLMYGL